HFFPLSTPLSSYYLSFTPLVSHFRTTLTDTMSPLAHHAVAIRFAMYVLTALLVLIKESIDFNPGAFSLTSFLLFLTQWRAFSALGDR
ncbi:hypothetical protein BGY98DRAFT_1025400, partial [Russula aff. rugulosa BPL654]